MLSFERPALLALLALIPAFALVRRLFFSSREGLRYPLAPWGGRPFEEAPFAFRTAWRARNLLVWIGLVALIAAAAGPARFSRRLVFAGKGNEIMLVVDVSPSMAASDFKPTRLEAAKTLVADFLGGFRNETVGVVAFGGEAALLSPPTLDYAAIRNRLSQLKPGLLGEGTALGAGLATAAAHAARSAAPEKHIILLTDGENNAGAIAPETAAALAVRAGMRVSVVGIGARGDTPVAYIDPDTGEKRSGTYRSGFDRAALESLARAGGGLYFNAASEEALGQALAALSERSLSLGTTRSIAAEDRLSSPFIALGLLALALARLLGLFSGGGLP